MLHPLNFLVPMNEISKEELALYDRQIRLWGLEAQKKYLFLYEELAIISNYFQITGRFYSHYFVQNGQIGSRDL